MTANKPSVKIFLSMVTSEFQLFRKVLTGDLRRSLLIEVKVQEDFGGHTGTLLEKLDAYIKQCDLVIHLIGQEAGTLPPKESVDRLKQTYPDLVEKVRCLETVFLLREEYKLSYTQWEAYLAIYHHPNGLFVLNHLPPDSQLPVVATEDRGLDSSQQEHLQRLLELGWDCTSTFSEPKDLSTVVYRNLCERHLARERTSARWVNAISTRCRKAWTACCRWWHSIYRNTQPTWRSLGGDNATYYWLFVLLRVCAVLQAIQVLRIVFSEVNLSLLAQDRSLQGFQQSFILSWLREFSVLHVVLLLGVVFVGIAAWPWLKRRLGQIRSLWKADQEENAWHLLLARSADLVLIPFELTVVLPTIPIAASQWMQSVERQPPVNGIDLTNFAYAGIIAAQFLLVVVVVVRYWPVLRHWWRHIRRDLPWPTAVLMAISGALGLWILFDPLLIPTGSAAVFSAQGSAVTHLAVDPATMELAIASERRRGSSATRNSTTDATGKPKDKVSIQIAKLPSLKDWGADFDGVPWDVEYDRDRIMGLAFHDRLLTVHQGELLLPNLQRFRQWHRDRSNQVADLDSLNAATLGNGGNTKLDDLGRVITFGNVPILARLQEEPDPTLKPFVALAEPPLKDLRKISTDWAGELHWITVVAISRDGRSLAVAGLKTFPPHENDNPYSDATTHYFVGVGDTAKGNLLFTLHGWTDALAFSPDGEWLLTHDDGIDHSTNLTESLGHYSSQHQIVFHRLSDRKARSVPIPERPAATIWSPDSRYVAVRYPYLLEVYSVLRGEKVASFISPRGRFTCHVYSPDGKYLLAGSDRGSVWMYQVADPEKSEVSAGKEK